MTASAVDADKAIFERIYDKPGAFWTQAQPPQSLRDLVEAGEVPAGRALDVGCGEGFYSIYLASEGFDVLGVDLSEKAVAHATRNAKAAGSAARFLAGTIADLDRAGPPFDFVLEWSILHHIAPGDRGAHVAGVAERMSQGGRYLVVCFNDETPGASAEPHVTGVGTKLYFSSMDELKTLYEPLFRIVESKITETGALNHRACYYLLEKR